MHRACARQRCGRYSLSGQRVRHTVAELSRSDDPRRDLERLIAAFNGDRYVRATLVLFADNDIGRTLEPAVTSTLDARLHQVPDWFLRLLGLAPESVRIQVEADDFQGIVVIEADPRNEALEIWDEFGDALLVVALFCGLTVLLIGWFAGRAVARPLNHLSSALYRIGEGDYGARIPRRGPSELARLAASFNRMADRLASTEARNRRLREQLLTLQEEKRAALARDLHDEIGPYLFAINVDAATIVRLAEEKRAPEIPAQVIRVHEAVAHMQAQVKTILGRLRPAGLLEFGLKQAVDHLLDFWRARHLKSEFKVGVTIGTNGSGFGELIDATLYRVIQEGLCNAVRHGHANCITVTVETDDTGSNITASIIDDREGLAETTGRSETGFGLLGMRERVAALGGSLTIADRSDSGDRRGGLAVVARLPRPMETRSPRSAGFRA
jgi:two-component system sensor histidine kinase UhpB